jgi:hypothetical protein
LSYTVLCEASAEKELAAAYLAAASPTAVTEASRSLESLLGQAPLLRGESRDGTVRVAFEPPLAVWFTVSEVDRLVVIIRFRLIESA